MKDKDKKRGLYPKYYIEKSDGSSCDSEADYFVLRLDKDEHARKAILAYADSVESENPVLATDIRDRVKQYK